MEYFDLSERFTADRFPTAVVAVVAGSKARATRTASSDIDLLLSGDDLFNDDRSSRAATYEFENEVSEVFAYTRDAFEQWARGGVAQYRPVIVHMLLEGVALRGGQLFTKLRDYWRGVIAAGPVVSQQELDMRRHVVTDLLDDLRDFDDDRADSLSMPLLDGKLSVFADAAERELNVADGRVQGGYVR
jgi:predicted nucleotidyltransferase